MKLAITVRPLRPEWDADSEVLDLDSFCRTHVCDIQKISVFYYLKGWIDAGYIIIAIDEIGGN